MSPERTRPATLAEVMAQALGIERDAAERYSSLADVMEVHNNREVAELFRKMVSDGMGERDNTELVNFYRSR